MDRWTRQMDEWIDRWINVLQTIDINKQNIYILNFILELSSNYANDLKITQEVVTLKNGVYMYML